MIPRTREIHSQAPENERPSGAGLRPVEQALELCAELAARYQISSLHNLLEATRAALNRDEIAIAVLGRFKAGKSSFLNDLLGRSILPVGVVPVTTAVTEIRYGPEERAAVHRLDGAREEIPLSAIGSWISEKENPGNWKRVALLSVDSPDLRRFRGLRFVDTPGLDSPHAHDTRTSLNWLPNVELALVAVSANQALSQQDLDLLRTLNEYTPQVGILLTKADLLNERELSEVLEFVRAQLAGHCSAAPAVFPYSTKPGFERFRQDFEKTLFAGALGNTARQRAGILARKAATLLRETGDYLALSLASAEKIQAERRGLQLQVVGEKEIVDEVKSQVRLTVRDAAAGAMAAVSARLATHRNELEQAMLREFADEFPQWTGNIATMLAGFEAWLADALRDRLGALSIRERIALLAPLGKAQAQCHHILQHFRDRLSERTMRAFHVALRTTETEIEVAEPTAPDVRIGRVFDRNWELLSPVLPVWAIQGVVRRHFENKVSYLMEQNLSRLSAQWDDGIRGALQAVEKEANRRLDELMATLERLVEAGGSGNAALIRADLERLDGARKLLS